MILAMNGHKICSQGRVHLFFSIIFLLFPVFAYATSSCSDLFAELYSRYDHSFQPKTKKLQFANPPILRLTSYSMHDGTFNQATVSERQFNGESFDYVGAYLAQMVDPQHDGEMLGAQQDFSLNKMVETEYLSATEAEYFRNLGLGLHRNQVYFWEVYHQATREELEQNYDENNDLFRSIFPSFFNQSNELWEAKTAAMWNVTGQVWDHKNTYVPLKLPWELEEARKDFALDRSKYKFVFEWGRAAQDLSGDIEHIYAANTLFSLIQVFAYQGSVDDAYVMVHSFDKVNTRLYSRMHPNTLYPPGWENLDDALFLVPLREAVKKYPIERVSERVRRVMMLSGGKLGREAAARFIVSDIVFKKSEMHFFSNAGEQATPVVISDNSIFPALMIYGLGQAAGLTLEEVHTLSLFLFRNPVAAASYNYLDKYRNAENTSFTADEYFKRRAIEISNLDPVLAQFDQFYVLRALFSTLHHKIQTYAMLIHEIEGTSLEESYVKAGNMFKAQKIKIGVSAHSPVILQQAHDLQPVETVRYSGTAVDGSAPLNISDVYLPHVYREGEMNFFTVEQIMNWAIGNPEMYRELRDSLREGPWTSQYLLSTLPDSL